MGIMLDEPHAHLVTPITLAQLLHAARGFAMEEVLCTVLDGGIPARLGLVEIAEPAPGRPLLHQTIRLCAAELRLLLEESTPMPLGKVGAAGKAAIPAFDEALLAVATRLLRQRGLLCLRGTSPRALRQFALDLASSLDLEARWFQDGDGHLPWLSILRTRDALPVLDLTSATQLAPQLRQALAEAQRSNLRLLVLASNDLAGIELPSVNVARLGWREAQRVWLATTQDRNLAQRLASRFRVNFDEAAAACRYAAIMSAEQPDGDGAVYEGLIATKVLEDGSRRMGRLVTHLQSAAALKYLVASPALHAQLSDIVDWQRNSARVFGEMRMGRLTPLGRGLTCLFAGPPGTGKTFAAQCLANELGLNLYRIDLSQVVSKYIGETEKALATIFEEAEAGHGVLLFDEADALFGKRSEVKDAHDRYANIEVGYLLQRIESYEGIAILATNLRSNMDSAFLRRIRFLLDFPIPDAEMRRRLWEQALPCADYIAEDVDLAAFVTRFRLSGGSIQNIGIAAAHMAAATPEGRITVRQLVRATYRELVKSGQSLDRVHFGDLADYLPQEVT